MRTRPFGLAAAALGLNRRSPEPRRAAIAALMAGEDAAAAAGDIQYRVVEEIVDLVALACAEGPVVRRDRCDRGSRPNLSIQVRTGRRGPFASRQG